MSRFRKAVLRVKNGLRINNVYECARPVLVLAGLFGVGGTRMCRRGDGVDRTTQLRSSKFSLLVFILMSLIYSPWYLFKDVMTLFTVIGVHYKFATRVAYIILCFIQFLMRVSLGVGCLRTHVYCKRVDAMFQIINNIDRQLEQANIRVTHWKITLKVMLLTVVAVDHRRLWIYFSATVINSNVEGVLNFLIDCSTHLIYMWTTLVLLIIHERFVGLNKLLQETAPPVTSIQIVVGERRNPRDNFMLRRITLARHVHEQLADVVQLFSDTWRYVLAGLLLLPIVEPIYKLLMALQYKGCPVACVHSLSIPMIRLLALVIICQANKAQRRVLSARLRHLVAFETDRETVHQVQQYIMYNAHCAPGLIDFQFNDIDNTLLLAVLDVIASNALIVYSYTRLE